MTNTGMFKAMTDQLENKIRNDDLARMMELSKKQAIASEKLTKSAVDASEKNLADLRNSIDRTSPKCGSLNEKTMKDEGNFFKVLYDLYQL
jgi:hypothetical protein